ncbi:MAG: hypothetical protein V4543_14730 [Bacteroidota bacterium]
MKEFITYLGYTTVGFGVFGGIVGLVLKTYLGEKAKNLATIEEVSKITFEVEKVRIGFSKEMEEVKAQLSFKNQIGVNFKNAEREALIVFNKNLSALIFAHARFDLIHYSEHNYQEAKANLKGFSQLFYDCDIAKAHVMLFMHDKEILDTILKLEKGIVLYVDIADRFVRTCLDF